MVGWLLFTLGRGVSEKASTEDVLFVEEIEGIPSIEMLGGLLLLLLIEIQDTGGLKIIINPHLGSEGREEKDEREGNDEGSGSGGRPGT